MTWAVLLIRNFVTCKVHDSANPADDGGRTQQQKVFIKFLRLSSPRPPPRPPLPCPALSLSGSVGWAMLGTIFCAVSDRPTIFVLFIRDVPGRTTKRRLLRGDFTQLASNPTLPPSLPPVPRLSELHQNCHMRRPATTQQQWLLPLLGQKIPKSGADHKLG